MTVKQVIIEAAKFGDKIALYDDKKSIPFKDLETEIKRFHSFIVKNVLSTDLKFGVSFNNRIEYLLAYLSAFYSGNPIVPINTRLSSKEIEYIIQDSDISMVLVDNNTKNEISDMMDPECVVNIDDYHYDTEINNCTTEVSTQTIASINYTSGTTGYPKGVMLAQKNHLTSCNNFLKNINELNSANHIHHVLPLSHSTVSLLIPAIKNGITTGISHCLGPGDVLKSMAKFKFDTLLLYPSLLIDIVDLVKKSPELADNLKSVRTIIYGSSPISIEKLIDAFNVLGPILIQAYGMTETLPPTSVLNKEDHIAAIKGTERHLLFSCGKIAEGIQIAILDDLDNELPEEEIGEVCVKGDNVTVGYYGKAEETKKLIINGWAHTGDLGYIKKGYLYLVDRKKDLIIRRGQNIYPAEVERVISGIEGIEECAVFGVPHSSDGEVPYCAITTKDNNVPNNNEIKDYLKMNLAEFKIPLEFVVLDVLPRNANGKVDKIKLKEPYWNQKRMLN